MVGGNLSDREQDFFFNWPACRELIDIRDCAAATAHDVRHHI
jgi:hypothetical protein